MREGERPIATDQPKVNANVRTPGSGNSLSNWRPVMGWGCRIKCTPREGYGGNPSADRVDRLAGSGDGWHACRSSRTSRPRAHPTPGLMGRYPRWAHRAGTPSVKWGGYGRSTQRCLRRASRTDTERTSRWRCPFRQSRLVRLRRWRSCRCCRAGLAGRRSSPRRASSATAARTGSAP